ncbi:polysaccharide pyruvyl transferase family protein [Roseovarius amoyensis]|uniref:polysaccharide pyruvyl transferase family protein n=1 Tax=Roseovarius amoyensis TaxID=2211448 RepID=UPI000DBE1F94|nr:polysaccharide pyruvyl transferase family protein [Roseovarius amoyensis]
MKQLNDRTPSIALITRTKTINQGNQALSVAWRDYLAARYPEARVRLFERVPKYLRRYSVSALAAERDPVAVFDRIARRLLHRISEHPGPDPSVWDVRLDPAQQRVFRLHRLRHALRLRSRIAALNLGASEYLNRLSHLTQADLVVVNPAGEFHASSSDTALLYLLEARCAQLAGCRTAFVNLSFEVVDPTVILLSGHVFAACDVVEFRDEESRVRLEKQAGDRGVVVLPDGVIMSEVSPAKTIGGNGLALAIAGPQIAEQGFTPTVREVISTLSGKGKLTLTSNEWATDRPHWNSYLDVANITFSGHGLYFDDYARFLAAFDVVVSSRLHTCVLGMLAGAVIVPIECGTFKLTGFFNQIGMRNEPIRIGSDNWQVNLINKIEEVQTSRDARLAIQNKKINRAVRALRSGLDDAFDQEILIRANS